MSVIDRTSGTRPVNDLAYRFDRGLEDIYYLDKGKKAEVEQVFQEQHLLGPTQVPFVFQSEAFLSPVNSEAYIQACLRPEVEPMLLMPQNFRQVLDQLTEHLKQWGGEQGIDFTVATGVLTNHEKDSQLLEFYRYALIPG